MSDPTRAYPPDPNQDTRTGTADGGSATAGEIVAPAGYELHEERGRGGMGVVFRARDLDLGREVAVKILQPHYAPNSSSGNRFLEEARITGRLQHPGIPAIYRVGKLPDGRPFLAMKLINGQTLEEKLKERNNVVNETGTGLTPFEQAAHGMLDRLDAVLRRGRFLAVFEQVAQAVGYAHKEGVIHRDLKPSNVMVGAFGEVQVMDWGLAKYADRKPATTARADGDSVGTVEYTPDPAFGGLRGDVTLAGSVLGTPAYMPPEQAIGAIDQIGKPSDVFGLGAILCVILTGEPPYVGETIEATRQLAARAKQDDAFVRLDSCGAEPELIALAKRCLAPEPADRPRDAGEVATAVAALRAEAEQRARQAEMDRARAEVKTTEERKRRRVQRALALSVLGLLVVAAYTARRIDNEVTNRRLDREAQLRRSDAEKDKREADLRTRQLTTERDVLAALNEVQVLREEGIKQADDPARWALTLTNANSAYKRAEGLLAAGEPTDGIVLKVAAAKRELEADRRDRTLLAELDRTADDSEMRLLLRLSFTNVTSRRFAAAFRENGIDLMTVPTDEAVAWLKGHRLRNRLVTAIRNWQQSFPPWDAMAVLDIHLAEAVVASAAVAGSAPVVAIMHDPNKRFEVLLRTKGPHAQLTAILKAVTEDPFTKEWWDAVSRKNAVALKTLTARPELRRLSSREMASLADGLNPTSGNFEVLDDFLEIAYDRFPGEFWVNFRLARRPAFGGTASTSKATEKPDDSLRHLTAAVAARPNSAIARVALGIVLFDKRKDSQAGLRMLHSAAEVDPTSPWPGLYLGVMAMEKRDWTEASRAFQLCVRADPDTGFFMIYSMMAFDSTREAGDPTGSTDPDFARLVDELIAARPDHPGGYDLLGMRLTKSGEGRAALAAFNKAKSFVAPDYPGGLLVAGQVAQLEALAQWEEKLPAVVRGEIRPADSSEVSDLVRYCAMFEKKYALAARLAADGLKADPKLFNMWPEVARFAGYAVQASAGNGTDAANLTPAERADLRRQALAWVRKSTKWAEPTYSSVRHHFSTIRDFDPVRDPKELAKLPPDERAEWEKFWADVTLRAPAPTPREVKRP